MEGLRVARTLVVPERELQWRFSRSGGPGGQNVNRRKTQVELIFDVSSSEALGPRQRERVLRRLARRLDADGRLRIVVSEERTQGRNREIALERLRALLGEGLKPDPPKRKPSKPGRAAKERRLRSKRIRGERKRQRKWSGDD